MFIHFWIMIILFFARRATFVILFISIFSKNMKCQSNHIRFHFDDQKAKLILLTLLQEKVHLLELLDSLLGLL